MYMNFVRLESNILSSQFQKKTKEKTKEPKKLKLGEKQKLIAAGAVRNKDVSAPIFSKSWLRKETALGGSPKNGNSAAKNWENKAFT